MYKIGWFSSGRGPGSRALLKAMQESIETGNVKAEIAFVFCNREPGFSEETDQFHHLVQSYSIPLVCYSSVKFRENRDYVVMSSWRIDYDREVMRRLVGFPVDLCVLAGYMLVIGPEMCQRYTMINLHPAAPGGPKGTWKEVIWELIQSRAQSTGVMMHLVTPELDEGPPLSYCTFRIRGKPFDEHWQKLEHYSLEELKAREGEEIELFKLIRQHGLKREYPLIIRTVKACSEGRVKAQNGRILDRAGTPLTGYDLTEEIDRLVA
ncbi:MAG: formyltransferase family protein [Dehalococcoidia bacterium]|nr:formyltransferase family protein [Dehalococcoidia bacterium]